MRLSTFLSPALLALSAITAAEGTSDVVSLTSANFESVVNPEPLILVEFFAPWYGTPAPIHRSNLSHERSGVGIVRLLHLITRRQQRLSERKISNSQRWTAWKSPISARPMAYRGTRESSTFALLAQQPHQAPPSTLKVFRDGVSSEYTGPRKADGIISYMIKSVSSFLLYIY
jgi:protein disulfide-isomerase A1